MTTFLVVLGGASILRIFSIIGTLTCFPDLNDGVHQVLGWVKSPSRPFSCRQIPHLMKAAGLFSTLLLILGLMSYR